MRNGVDHDVEYDRRQDALARDKREIWLPLPAQPDSALVVIAAYPLAQDRVFDQDPESEQVQLCVLCDPVRPVRMLKQIGCQRQET